MGGDQLLRFVLNGLGLVSYHQGKFAVMVKVMLGAGVVFGSYQP